jgi:hypothetical protein
MLKRMLLIPFVCVFLTPTTQAGQKVNQSIDLGGNRQVTWYLPDSTPGGWVFLQHGFSRDKSNMDDLATHLMDNGLMVLTANCSVSNGNPNLAQDVGDDLVDNPPTPPNGFVLPSKLVLAGHSAGGLFVAFLGGHLTERNYTELVGMILLDPVDKNNGMNPNMQAMINAGQPALSILANSSSCNSSNNALQPLQDLSDAFVGIKLTDNSKHTDAEGDSTGGILTWMCGSPSDQNVAYLQDFTFHWADDMVFGSLTPEYYPGGSKIQDLLAVNDGVLIKEMSGPICGNGIVEEDEECDGGNCCDSDCYLVAADTECRATASECDLAEACDGEDAACPADVFKPDGTNCSAGVCQSGQCTGSDSPTADYTFTTSELSVDFADTSTDDGSIVDWAWDFDDNTTSSAQNPSHTYASAGIYSVSLTVTDNDGQTDTETKSITVEDTQPPEDDELINGNAITVSEAKGTWKHFFVNLPAGASNLSMKISGGSGDADLYTRFGAQPTSSSYDCRPYKNGNNENCTVANPQAGKYYVSLHAYNAYSNASLVATFEGGELQSQSNSNANITGQGDQGCNSHSSDFSFSLWAVLILCLFGIRRFVLR